MAMAMATATETRRARVPVWALISAAWLAPALLGAIDAYAQARLDHRSPSWRLIAWVSCDWLIYGILTPVVFRLSRRFPLRRHVALHSVASLVLCVVWAGTGIILRRLMIPGPYGGISFQSAVSWFFTTLPFGVLVYFAVIGVERATHYFTEAETRERHLAEATLAALRMQLHPHFLFNSLNALGVLVRDQDTAAASRMIELLSDVLRDVLDADQAAETTLGDEVGFLERYLAIEQVRFSDRLRPVFDIEPGVRSAAVPTFVLQPLVENALRHGIAKRTDAGIIRIAARREGGDLVLTVEDDGVGLGASSGEGIGLANTRARLVALYGPQGSLSLSPRAGGGVMAEVRLPYHV
jgi:two-component system LytT family sensor kinase